MGCICSKGGKSTNEYVARNHPTQLNPNKSSKHLAIDTNDSTTRLISNTYRNSSDEGDKKNVVGIGGGSQVEKDDDEKEEEEEEDSKRISRCLSYGERGSLIVVGWPSWLTSVAPEAIAGWIPRRPDSFHKLDKASKQKPNSHFNAFFFIFYNPLLANSCLYYLSHCRLVKELTAVFTELAILKLTKSLL
jgi:hypothetical protein